MFQKVSLFVRRNAGLLAVACLLVLAGSVLAADPTGVDTGIQSIIDSTSGTFTAVKTVIISVVLFMLGLKVVKMLRRA